MPSPFLRRALLVLGALALIAVPLAASAPPDAVATYTYTQNMHPQPGRRRRLGEHSRPQLELAGKLDVVL
jgi:hypothetical protein